MTDSLNNIADIVTDAIDRPLWSAVPSPFSSKIRSHFLKYLICKLFIYP